MFKAKYGCPGPSPGGLARRGPDGSYGRRRRLFRSGLVLLALALSLASASQAQASTDDGFARGLRVVLSLPSVMPCRSIR